MEEKFQANRIFSPREVRGQLPSSQAMVDLMKGLTLS
jgi:hypothetical protein